MIIQNITKKKLKKFVNIVILYDDEYTSCITSFVYIFCSWVLFGLANRLNNFFYLFIFVFLLLNNILLSNKYLVILIGTHSERFNY